MSKDFSSYRFAGGSSSSLNLQDDEGNENEFESAQNPAPCPLSRSPLSSIPDPSQKAETDLDTKSTHGSNQLRRLFEKKADVMEYVTPRNGRRKSHSEPNSAQSTPARTISRFSNAGGSEAYAGSRPPQHAGGRGGCISRSSRGLSAVPPPLSSCEVPHFDLMEDSSFWMDHNVQVLIRIRPLSGTEKVLQGSGRCLRQESAQTLIWLGHPETRFTFDHVACETISQEKLFKVAGSPMVENCMSGYNSCMFAYGQTGSGKTYTMMGDIYEMNNRLSEDCGMTPRIFEYLFMRIREEEENRRDERLNYSCKCSFLEIYNEQITDLLQPESTNLQLREDIKKGVYVENLKEYEVTNVKDVLKLLLQGAANRKIAATHMNGESSRSHSVFTCVIESQWEKDSMAHVRFGRLNLVDLAGSERQKSSGAEGDRLKEAANINKSLSTLGLVIMTLVDIAHGKQRHVPYRDSRLTFLLQDSLGGNSKTTIVANISPSICSANETLSTLKFARRAKLIQNNAKVNEDASGDVIILQQQIQQLKEQLNFLKSQTISRLSHHLPSYDQAKMGDLELDYDSSLKEVVPSVPYDPSVASRKLKYLESTLVGSLRREKTAETAIRRLEAENEHLNHLVNQREEDVQCTKMLLRFREEKIRKMEMLVDGLFSADEYLIEENKILSEEIQLLQARVDKNPEITRFAMENIRLIEQLRMFQDFYERGERETLLAEVSELRDQLLEILEGRPGQTIFPQIKDEAEVEKTTFSAAQERVLSHVKVDSTLVELEDCRTSLVASLERNALLTEQVEDLRDQLKRYLNSTETCDNVELISASREAEDEIASSGKVKEELKQNTGETIDSLEKLQPADAQKELIDARYLIEALEAQQLQLIEELDNLRQENSRYLDLLQNQAYSSCLPVVKLQTHCEPQCRHRKNHELREPSDQIMECGCDIKPGLQKNWERMQQDLEAARSLNLQYQNEQASQQSHQYELEQVCEEVEVETAKTILHLQEEVATLHREIDSKNENESSAKSHYWLLRMENHKLQDRVCVLTQENISLKNAIASRDSEISSSNEEWEKAVVDLTSFLVDGHQSLEDASDHIESIVHSFSEKKAWVGEEVEKAVKVFIEKEQIILDLQSRVADAQNLGLEMKLKLDELKRAALAISEVQELENSECSQDVLQLRMLLNEKMSTVKSLETQIKIKEDQIIESEKQACAAFLTIKVLREMMTTGDSGRIQNVDTEQNIQILEEIRMQLEGTMKRVLDSENAICASYIETEKHLSSIIPDILNTFAAVHQMIQDISNEICTLWKKFKELKEENTKIPCLEGTYQSLEVCGFSNPESQYNVTHRPRSELASTNEKLDALKTSSLRFLNLSDCSIKYGDTATVDRDDATYGVCMKRLSQLKCVVCSNEMGAEEEMCTKVKDSRQFVEEKMKQANNLLKKFEEAQETIKEADLMLNALLKVNENAKHKKNKWKQAAEELMMERASLIEEVQQLEASIQLKEEQNVLLQDQIRDILEHVAEALSSLDNIFTDICSSRQVLLDSITASRSWLEDICAQVMEEMFALFVQYQCYIGALSDKCLFFNKYCKYLPYGQTNPCLVLGSVGNCNGEGVLKEESKHELHSSGGRNPIKTVQAAVSISDVDSVKSGESDLSAEVKHLIIEVSKLEKEKSDIAHDMLLIELAISRQLACLENFEKDLTYVASDGTECIHRNQNAKTCDISVEQFHGKGFLSSENASRSIVFKDPTFQFQKIQMQKVGPVVNEIEPFQADVGGVTSDEDGLIAGINYLKAWCAQMSTVLAKTKGHAEGHFELEINSNDIGNGILLHVMKTQMEPSNCSEPRSEYGQHLTQQLQKMEGKLTYLKDYIKSRMYGEARNVFNEFLIETLHQGICNIEEKACKLLVRPVAEEARQTDVMLENLSLRRELARKEVLLEGLFFDLRLLQESTSNVKDINDETEEMVATLSQVQEELACKSTLMDEISVQYEDLKVQLADREAALASSKSELGQVKETLNMILADNTELRLLLEDIYLEKNGVEQQLEEKEEIVQGLEREILQMDSSIEERIRSSVAEIEEKLRRVTSERDQFQEEMVSLNGKLEMSNALADENEAIAVEARQVAEASKVYAEQKEEEVRILEHSVEELECTINVLEQKVDEMGEEVERHRAMREDLELELQALRSRMMNVESATENFDAESLSSKEMIECQLSRKIDDRIMELTEAKRCVRILEKEKAEQEKEIQKCKDYISELVLHSEAQASQYQQKYKSLEDMVREVKANPATPNLAVSTTNKMEKSTIRPRGSGSPFKCIASLVQQMNSEKDQELKLAQFQIQELEALAASRQKEICMLNARLARTENMTHDVIRDLLGVKLDITNYANLIDQLQLQKLAETAQQQTEESNAKEHEILCLRKQIDDFIAERESLIEEINQRQAEMLTLQVTIEQLQQRDQLLMAQNEMLKKEKANLKKKVGELDEMVRKLFGSQAIQRRVDHPMGTKDKSIVSIGNDEVSRRLTHSEKLLSHEDDKLALYCNISGNRTGINNSEHLRHRNRP